MWTIKIILEEHLKVRNAFDSSLYHLWSFLKIDSTLKWSDWEAWLFTKDWAGIKETKERWGASFPVYGGDMPQCPLKC